MGICSDYLKKLRTEPCSRLFWRDMTAEFFGTFFLILVHSSLLLHADDDIAPLLMGLCIGFTVTVLMWTLGDFGHGHYNPAITIALAAKLDITFIRAILYIGAQCAGAIGGAGAVYGLTGSEPSILEKMYDYADRDIPVGQRVAIEALITIILIITFLGSINQRRKGHTYMATIPIGMAYALGSMCAYSYTGGIMNPARSLGPMVVTNQTYEQWVYFAGPIAGGLIGMVIYTALDTVDRVCLRNKHQTPEVEERTMDDIASI